VHLLCWSTTAPTYRLITEPEAGYRPIYELISSAGKTLDMTMYALVDPKATAALIADAKRGVAVRVLLDSDPAGGGGPAMNQAAYNDLKPHGVKVRWAWPGVLWHQKSIVRDVRAVAVMTCDLYAAYYPRLRDFVVNTNSPATVSGVEATFNADLKRNHTPPAPGVVPKGSELIRSSGAQRRLARLIGSARPGSTLYAETEQLGDRAGARGGRQEEGHGRSDHDLLFFLCGRVQHPGGRRGARELVSSQRPALHPGQGDLGQQPDCLRREQQFHESHDE